MQNGKLTIVVPVCNEAESLAALHGEIDAVARSEGYDLDLIFVDDGSRDDSWKVISELADRDDRVRGIRFRRNFGKAAALSAGFADARGERVLTLDGDLQDDPHEIPKFLARIDEGLDLVSGWKKVRHDPWHKVLPSRVFNALVSRLTGVKLHDHNCGMKCFRRDVVREVRLYGELHRFVPVLAAARGFKVGEVVIQHRARKFGRSKYGVRRFIKGFLDLLTVKFLTGFGQRPLHVLGTLGLVCFFAGLVVLLFLTGAWVATRATGVFGPPIHLHERALFFYALGALLLGGQFMTAGLLAEMVIANSNRDADAYSIAERTASAEEEGAMEDASGERRP
ncbi:MAG: glycosyltransferase family 2 protein [Planctomycetia bacterium]|nr:glycosyltransferase family 2 protein [Planctomycetia bacterium]